jgi:HD-GYP domain-containing protein (c-di-GMP phosphodiesterase class II)
MHEKKVAQDIVDKERAVNDREHTNMNAGKDKQDDNEGSLIEAIGQSLDELDLSFDIEELNILDDENAKPRDIEALKENLGATVSTRLFSLANSTHFARISSGKITKFTDVITRLGTEFTRATAIFIVSHELAITDRMKLVIARNFATSKLAEIIAYQMKLSIPDRNTVILGGLFIEIGKLIMLLYAHNEEIELDEDFIQEYHSSIGIRVIEKFELPVPLKEIIHHSHFTFVKKNSFALSALTDMAYRVVDESFNKHGKLIVESAMPDPDGILYNSTVGSMILSQFQLMGLGAYVQVVPAELTDIEQRLIDKSGEK